jgi:hypothetical protein
MAVEAAAMTVADNLQTAVCAGDERAIGVVLALYRARASEVACGA